MPVQYAVEPGLFTPGESRRLLRLSLKRLAEECRQAEVVTETGEAAVDLSRRRSSMSTLSPEGCGGGRRDAVFVRNALYRAGGFAGRCAAVGVHRGGAIRGDEESGCFYVNRYVPGDMFHLHMDGSPDPSSPVHGRALTVTVTLALPEEGMGGELDLEEPLPGRARLALRRPGSAIAFGAMAMHRVTPVKRGERISLVLWYQRGGLLPTARSGPVQGDGGPRHPLLRRPL